MMEIVQNGHPALRQIAQDIPVGDITSSKVQKVIKDMKMALDSQDDGVAIAAPQIGESLRVFVVSRKIFKDPEGEPLMTDDLVFINPKIIKSSRKTEWKSGEGCLSCRWLYGEVKRHINVTVEAYDEHGRKFTRGGGGLLAHIFQHEIDHLDGILFIDKARNLEEIPPAKNDENA